MTFEQLKIIDPILKALKAEGYAEPSPIQEQAIPFLLEGKDMLGSAQTGTGKTAAFAVPIIQGLYLSQPAVKGYRYIQALILAPTRELAAQIKDSFVTYGKNLGLKTAVIFGGVSQKPQTDNLGYGVDILVATPGRLLDLIGQKFINLSHVKYFVLDEADRMLDMGFSKDVDKIVKLVPIKRQTMLFSATMPNEILHLANAILTNPVRIAVTPVETTLEVIKQSVYHVNKKDKIRLLVDLLGEKQIPSALVFSRTKHGANKIMKDLILAGINAEAIHGNKSQSARETALRNFKTKKIGVLVATDIAARGIDIDELSHVINYDLPEVPETYIHRIGRTGRAGFSGIALTFCSEEEGSMLREIQKHIKMDIPVVSNHKYVGNFTGLSYEKAPAKPQFQRPSRNQSASSTQNSKNSNRYANDKTPKTYNVKKVEKTDYQDKSKISNSNVPQDKPIASEKTNWGEKNKNFRSKDSNRYNRNK